jgi:predicted glycosyltransferase
MSNRKNEVLGQSIGTASRRLDRKLLFYLAKKAGMGNCYRCGNPILSLKNFSVDHKIDWINSGNPIELYFDENNIAFSHLSCNIKYGNRNRGWKKNPDETKEEKLQKRRDYVKQEYVREKIRCYERKKYRDDPKFREYKLKGNKTGV